MTASSLASKLKSMKIYTKNGDKGKTRLVDGRECSKASLRVEAYGALDELNSSLGVVVSQLPVLPQAAKLMDELLLIQNELFNLGSHLACVDEKARERLPALNEKWIERLEASIDLMTEELPPLKNFILPGGSTMAAFFHLSRTVCRRAERLVVSLIDEGSAMETDSFCLRYSNRLSDFLFTAARFVNFKAGIPDQEWTKPSGTIV
jgi:cob(I)alamin adenosyltransferase